MQTETVLLPTLILFLFLAFVIYILISTSCRDHCAAPKRPHQAKEFHVRFLEKEKGKVEREGREERERSEGPSFLLMEGDKATGKGGR